MQRSVVHTVGFCTAVAVGVAAVGVVDAASDATTAVSSDAATAAAADATADATKAATAVADTVTDAVTDAITDAVTASAPDQQLLQVKGVLTHEEVSELEEYASWCVFLNALENTPTNTCAAALANALETHAHSLAQEKKSKKSNNTTNGIINNA